MVALSYCCENGCAECGWTGDVDAEPPVSIATGFEGSCEVCGVLVQVDERIHAYADDVVVHESCPGSRERARA